MNLGLGGRGGGAWGRLSHCASSDGTIRPVATRGTVKAVAMREVLKALGQTKRHQRARLGAIRHDGFLVRAAWHVSAIAIVAAADIVPPTAGAVRGAMTMPTTARTGSSRRSVRQNFTAVISHREHRVKRLTHLQRCQV